MLSFIVFFEKPPTVIQIRNHSKFIFPQSKNLKNTDDSKNKTIMNI